MDSVAERLIVLQDLRELRAELEDEGEVAALQELGFDLKDLDGARGELDEAIATLRSSLDAALLRRYETISRKYRRPLAPVRRGTCYGCFTRIPTGRFEEERRPDDLGTCPNCGRLVYEI